MRCYSHFFIDITGPQIYKGGVMAVPQWRRASLELSEPPRLGVLPKDDGRAKCLAK